MEDKERIDRIAEAYSKKAKISKLTGNRNIAIDALQLLNEEKNAENPNKEAIASSEKFFTALKHKIEIEMCEVRGHYFSDWQEQKIVDEKPEERFIRFCEFCGEVQHQNEVPLEYFDTEGKKQWPGKSILQKNKKR